MCCQTRRASLRRAKEALDDGCRRHRHHPVKTQHVLIATVRDASGNPVSGADVEWILARSDRAVHTLLTDEAGAKDLKLMVADATDQKRFAQWVRDEGLTPEKLGVASWDEAKLTADPGTPAPALYYYSQRFRAWSVAEFFRLCSEQVRLHFKSPSTQNFSDGAVYLANFYAQGNDYFTWFNRRALDWLDETLSMTR